MDLGSARYETFAELYEYCIRVASAVGLICLEIFGESRRRGAQYAIDLGVALQLTNILRDVRGGSRAAGSYIPQEDLRASAARKTICAQRAHAGRRRPAGGQGAAARSRPRAPGLLRARGRALPREDARRLVAAEIMAAHLSGDARRASSGATTTCSPRSSAIPRPARRDRRFTWIDAGQACAACRRPAIRPAPSA